MSHNTLLSTPPARHDWVWLKDDWQNWLLEAPRAQDLPHLTRWLGDNRPFVVARGQKEDAATMLRLGLCLPDKQRIALCVDHAAVKELAMPLPLSAVLENLPKTLLKPLHAGLDKLMARLNALQCPCHVFGSFAWQIFAPAGVTFITEQSDIDLLLKPQSRSILERALHSLHSHEQDHPALKLDGEIMLPDGKAVAWRELAKAPDTILVKDIRDVALLPLDHVYAQFGQFSL